MKTKKKKKLKKFEESNKEIPSDKRLKKEESIFQSQLKKLRSLIKPKKVNADAAIKSAKKFKPKKRVLK